MNVICNSNTNVTIQERKIHARMDSISRSWVAKRKEKKIGVKEIYVILT